MDGRLCRTIDAVYVNRASARLGHTWHFSFPGENSHRGRPGPGELTLLECYPIQLAPERSRLTTLRDSSEAEKRPEPGDGEPLLQNKRGKKT